MSASPISRRAFNFAALAALSLPLPTLSQSAIEAAAANLRKGVAAAIREDPTMAATLLRLSFHDSFTHDLVSKKGGANGSIRFETGRAENFGLERAVNCLKPIQESSGLGWGDAVAVAGAVAVEETGGPKIDVQLGRPTADGEDPTGILPSFADTVPDLRERFWPRGFDDRDIVALCGAHTLGRVSGGGPFVAEPNKFRNDYFQNLMWYHKRRQLGMSTKSGPPDRPNFQLPSDMYLLDDPKTLEIVQEFGEDQNAFFRQFAESYNKMVSVGTPFASR